MGALREPGASGLGQMEAWSLPTEASVQPLRLGTRSGHAREQAWGWSMSVNKMNPDRPSCHWQRTTSLFAHRHWPHGHPASEKGNLLLTTFINSLRAVC